MHVIKQENKSVSSVGCNGNQTTGKQANRKSTSTGVNKKNNMQNKQAANTNMTQLNSIRILTTTPQNSATMRPMNTTSTTSISKAPQAVSIKLNGNSYSSPALNSSLIISKESPTATPNAATKYITMTSAKLSNAANIKCQAITPTTNSNKAISKIVSTTSSNNLISLSSISTAVTNNTNLNSSSLKSTTFGPSSTTNFITTLKIPTSLSKISKKLTGKAKINDTNVAAIDDDDFYYEDEEFNKHLNANNLVSHKQLKAALPTTLLNKTEQDFKLNDNLTGSTNFSLQVNTFFQKFLYQKKKKLILFNLTKRIAQTM